MLKRTIVVLAVMAMLVGLLPGAAFATDPGATDVATINVAITGVAADGNVTGVVVKAGSKQLSVGSLTGSYNATTKVDTFSIASASEIDYDGDTTNDYPQNGDAATVEVTVSTGETYYFTGTLTIGSVANTATLTFAQPSGASLSGWVVEDNQAKGATGDNVYTAGSDTGISETAITIYKDGVKYATEKATTAGSWTMVLGAGTYTVKADVTGTTGNVAPAEFFDVDLCDVAANCPASPSVDQADEGEVQWFGGSATASGATSIVLGNNSLTGADIVYDNDSGVDPNTWDHIDVLSGAFSDTIGYWADGAIAALKTAGIVSGCTTTTFCPEANITRAEFAVMVSRAIGGSLSVVTADVYTDVTQSHWAAAHIQKLKTAKIVSGDSAGAFNPEAQITRAEAAAMLARYMVKYSGNNEGVTETDNPTTASSVIDTGDLPAPVLSFVDVPTSHWAAKEITWLVGQGVVKGFKDGTFGPATNLTRAEMAAMLNTARLDVADDTK